MVGTMENIPIIRVSRLSDIWDLSVQMRIFLDVWGIIKFLSWDWTEIQLERRNQPFPASVWQSRNRYQNSLLFCAPDKGSNFKIPHPSGFSLKIISPQNRFFPINEVSLHARVLCNLPHDFGCPFLHIKSNTTEKKISLAKNLQNR